MNQLPQGITIDSIFQFWAAVSKFASSSGQWYSAQIGPFDSLQKAVWSQQRTNSYQEQRARDWVPSKSNHCRQKPPHPEYEYRPQPWSMESVGWESHETRKSNQALAAHWGISYGYQEGINA